MFKGHSEVSSFSI